MAELVSVIVPTRDRLDDLLRAVGSVLAQRYPAIEVVVVDDGSTRDPVPVLAPLFQDAPGRTLRIHRNPRPMGGGYSRRRGTEVAQGAYVCFLDDDDLYLPDKLATLVAYLDAHPEVDAVFGRVIIREGQGAGVDRLLDYRRYRTPVADDLADICKLQTNGSLVRARALSRANFHEGLQKFQDTQFHIELCKTSNTHILETPVAIWHKNRSADQISHVARAGGAASIERFQALLDHLFSLSLLSPGERDFLERKKLKYFAEYGLYAQGLAAARARSLSSLAAFQLYWAYYWLGLTGVRGRLKSVLRREGANERA
ncbi:glycosyltransferase family 2 protein [Luteimonas abyssi]|uniref:glycosyltransferase family 2 protein n=1 Tax=Luteimonas abyssi TaxID=1247514 RepID=UPI000737D235|nr:glycosyltransferase family A protein [Luteimonas abyssi]